MEYEYKKDDLKFLDIYTEDFIRDLHAKLGRGDLNVQDIEFTLCTSAAWYVRFKNQQNNSFTPKEAVNKMQSYINKQAKALADFSELMDDFYIQDIFDGLFLDEYVHRSIFKPINLNGELIEEKAPLYDCHISGEVYKAITQDVLSTMERMVKVEPKNNYGMSVAYPLEHWVTLLSTLFVDSKIQFTQGKYYKEIGYVSECVNTLYSIINKVDSSITEQKIGEAIAKDNKEAKLIELEMEECRQERKKIQKLREKTPTTFD